MIGSHAKFSVFDTEASEVLAAANACEPIDAAQRREEEIGATSVIWTQAEIGVRRKFGAMSVI